MKKLGLTYDQVHQAHEQNRMVRYWPMRDRTGEPKEGLVQAYRNDELIVGRPGKPKPIVWLTGKSGFVLASHCELVEVEG